MEGALEVLGSGEEAFDGEELEARVAAAVGGGVEAGFGGFFLHGLGGFGEGDVDADLGLFALEDAGHASRSRHNAHHSRSALCSHFGHKRLNSLVALTWSVLLQALRPARFIERFPASKLAAKASSLVSTTTIWQTYKFGSKLAFLIPKASTGHPPDALLRSLGLSFSICVDDLPYFLPRAVNVSGSSPISSALWNRLKPRELPILED